MSHLLGKQIVIAGGCGFLGTSMAKHFHDAGAEVTVLSRSAEIGRGRKSPPKIGYCQWDARSIREWVEVLDGADVMVNFTGRTVNCIKTPNHQDEILRSRVESTLVLGKAMRRVSKPPSVWVQMSTEIALGCHWNCETPFRSSSH